MQDFSEPHEGDTESVVAAEEDERPSSVVDRQLREELHAHSRRVAWLESQLATVAEMLRDEATNRDWCSEYGEFVDKVNRRCGAQVLQHCNRTYLTEVTVLVGVTASGEQLAEEVVRREMTQRLLGDIVEGMEISFAVSGTRRS